MTKEQKIISDALIVKLLKKYKVGAIEESVPFFQKIVGDEVLKGTWELDKSNPELKKEFMKLKDTVFTYMDVAHFMEDSQRKSRPYPNKEEYVADKLVAFRNGKLTAYHQDNLANEDPEFAALFKEYQEGLLLFDLMETKVWNIAKSDSTGLQNFYKNNTQKYIWPERLEVTIATASKKIDADKAREMLAEGAPTDAIAKALNKDGKVKVIFTTKTVPQKDNSWAEGFAPKVGLSDVFSKDGFVFYQVHNILPSGPKTLEEARGQVISDYQKEVEENWLASLRKRAKIKVNKKTLKKLERKLKQ